MPPDKRKPPIRDRRFSGDDVEVACIDITRITPSYPKKQTALRRRCNHARNAVFEAFGYRHARAIDYDGFIDRKPTPAPMWWRSGP